MLFPRLDSRAKVHPLIGMIPREQIRRDAFRTLRDAGVEGDYPINLERVAESLGYESLGFEGKSDISGGIRYSSRKIFVNSTDPIVRQRFTLAHEIGHAVLHKGVDEVDYRREIDFPQSDKEREANLFAAELLMPTDDFAKVWATRGGNLTRVAHYFGVSQEAAKIQARTLNLL